MSAQAACDRVILIVLDSVGMGAARDASRFGDDGADTLGHIAQWCATHKPDFALPNLSRWGLGQLVQGHGIARVDRAMAATGILCEKSPGKDTTTGHWELAGNVLTREFPVFENGFPQELLQRWAQENNLPGWLCNKAASGTVVIEEFGEEHIRTGKPIVYTSADSVFQVACSEEHFGLERLYKICISARKLLDPLGIGRVIARPFVGSRPGEFKRTENRRDYSVPPPQPNLLDVLVDNKCFVAGVGKIEDIFAHRSVTIVEHTGRNETSCEATLKTLRSTTGQRGLVFTNLIDFDMLHGHRRNPGSYAQALMDFDRWLPQLEQVASDRDLVLLTADHGNDPTFAGTDHTRENVPLLTWTRHAGFKPQALGELSGFGTVARLALEAMGLGECVQKLDGARSSPSLVGLLGLVRN
jgi:phosphopentomutase